MYVWVETRDPNFTTIIPAEDIIEQNGNSYKVKAWRLTIRFSMKWIT